MALRPLRSRVAAEGLHPPAPNIAEPKSSGLSMRALVGMLNLVRQSGALALRLSS